MNHFRQHMPGWADFDRKEFDFSTLGELLGAEPVLRWREAPDFRRYSVSTSDHSRPMLMAELDEGYRWWVLGYLDSLEGIDLPLWEARYRPNLEAPQCPG